MPPLIVITPPPPRVRYQSARLSTPRNRVDRARGVGRVLADGKFALMVEQAVDDVRGLASVRGNDLGDVNRSDTCVYNRTPSFEP